MESESKLYQHQAEECAGTHQSDYTFTEDDVPGLAEALAEVAHKWEEIAVALRLSEAVRAECREGSSLAIKLYRVLHQWVVGQYSNAARATRVNLKTALASPLVQHPRLASKLEDKLKTSLSLHTLTTSLKKFESSVRDFLLKRYSQFPEVLRSFWPPVVNKRFTSLALIDTSGQPLKSDYSIRGDADDVLAKKKQVQYEELFSVYKEAEKILILGRPGSGKTTLVHKLVRDWSAGKALQGAELVFLVSLRMLSSDQCDLAQVLNICFSDEQKFKEVLDAIKRVRGKNVCFIFDGFDEYSPSDKEKSVIFQILNKSYLEDSMIIVTSRPAAASVAAAESWHTFFNKIEVFGFSRSQIMEYINTFPFSSSSNVNKAHSLKLQSFLSSHPGVLDLCYLPVNCAIICFIYDTKSDNLPDTQTQIYSLFSRLIIIRQLTSKDIFRTLDSLEDLEGQEAKDFTKLCSLAFDMTTQSQQVITRGPASSDEAHSLGLVTRDITAGLNGYENSYSFLHLTLQEFLAAYHLSKLNQEEQMSIIEKYGKTVHMLTVWKFYFGLVNFEAGLDEAKKLFAKVNSIKDFRVNTELFKIHCSYEAKQYSIVQLALSEILYFYCTLSNYDMSAITNAMSMAASFGNPVTSVQFHNWGPSDDKMKTFFDGLNDQALQILTNFEVSSTDIAVADIEALGHKLNFRIMQQLSSKGLKTLKYLRLNLGGITDEHVTVLAAFLDGNHVLESLELANNQISAAGFSELLKSDCHLRSLKLSGNSIGDEGVAALSARLNGNHELENLYLSYSSISVTGVSELMRVDCQLQRLDLSGNNLGDEGAMAVVRGLRGNFTLKSINLSSNEICIAGFETLALVLQENTLNLNLSDNRLRVSNQSYDKVTADSSSSSLSATSKESNTPQVSDGDPVTKHDEEVSRVPHYCNLEELDLSHNHCIGDCLGILFKFKSLSCLNISLNRMDLPEVTAVIDYVANSNSCQQLVRLELSSVMIGKVPANFVVRDRNSYYIDLHFGPGIMVDLSNNFLIHKKTAIYLLQTMKKYNRIRAVCLYLCNILEIEFAQLKKNYQHMKKSLELQTVN